MKWIPLKTPFLRHSLKRRDDDANVETTPKRTVQSSYCHLVVKQNSCCDLLAANIDLTISQQKTNIADGIPPDFPSK